MAATPLRRNRDFVLLQTGQALSSAGSESAAVAYSLLVLELTHSPAKAGLTAFTRLVPWVLFALPAGVAVDRWNRKRIMIGSDVVRTVALAGLGVAVATGHLTFGLVPLVAFVEGAMYVVFNIAEVGAVRSVVPTAQLPRAFATEQGRLSAVYLVGPPLGGFLYGVGRAIPFLVDACSYAFSTATLLAMRTPFQEDRDAARRSSVVAEVREGLEWLWSRPFLRTCALLFAAGNLSFAALELTLIVAARRQGLSAAAIGGLLGVVGALSLLGSVAAPRFQRLMTMRTVLVTTQWLALGIGAYVIWPNVFVLVAGAVPAFFLTPTLNAMIIGYRTALVPDRLQGRVTSVARTLALLGLPLGPVVAGALLASFSARATIALLLVWLALLAVVATVSRAVRDAPGFDEVAAASIS
jgi:Transmembrane secretion effector